MASARISYAKLVLNELKLKLDSHHCQLQTKALSVGLNFGSNLKKQGKRQHTALLNSKTRLTLQKVDQGTAKRIFYFTFV